MLRWKLLLAAALAAPQMPAEGQTHVGPEYIPEATNALPMWLSPPKEASAASCAIDVGVATVFLGTAGTSINAAVRSCKRQVTAANKAACSASISGVILGLNYASGFLSAAAADCQHSLQVVNEELARKATCAADLTTFIASLALLANSGSAMRQVCGAHLVSPADALSVNTRRLEESWQERLRQAQAGTGPAANATARDLRHVHSVAGVNAERMTMRSAEIAECVFDVGQATLFFARAGLMVNAAVADCSRFELRTGGGAAQARCAVDVSSVISAFSFAASGISYSCFHCPFWKHVVPACAGAIVNLISALSQIAAAGSSFEANCGQHGRRLLNATQPADILV